MNNEAKIQSNNMYLTDVYFMLVNPTMDPDNIYCGRGGHSKLAFIQQKYGNSLTNIKHYKKVFCKQGV